MIYSISDLHLDYTKAKTMELFGNNWDNYEERIFSNWSDIVKEDDLVLVSGDISWAMNLKEAYYDLIRIDKLPGKKILLKGNHDYWWDSLNKNNSLDLKSIFFLQNNHFNFQGVYIVGTRGWENLAEDSEGYKIFRRELLRLKLSLDSVPKDKQRICMLHYPPFNKEKEPNDFHYVLKEYGIKKCIYGHLHGPGLVNVVEGFVDGVEYYCTSSDYLNFKPIQIMDEFDFK
ncbi:metallophosphoesterase [Lagierella sp.]|uniref:metallophosphoesterase n=1 Tax=Lagierella sp. TaxID=2849657 RepID=UPI0026035872|nr:metallophosphoesterase [Lagierella sp.]